MQDIIVLRSPNFCRKSKQGGMLRPSLLGQETMTPEALFDILAAAVSADAAVRVPAEQKLSSLCGTPGYMSSLLAIVEHDQVVPPIR